ncbi:MAG: hypothetical protein AAF985_20950, partial [Bacteroidota bacterium]
HDTEASGKTATALGHQTKAPSYAETVLGTYNTDYTPANTNSFAASDRLLVVGNGTADNSRSDALIVHKSGDTQINGRLSIHNSGATPDSSAMLDISSTSKGILIPRMTTSQRSNINNPATGLMVYDTETIGFWFYDGTNWVAIKDGMVDELVDTDEDTKIQVERNTDEDHIRFTVAGKELITVNSEVTYLNGDSRLGYHKEANSSTVADYSAQVTNNYFTDNTIPGWQSFIPNANGFLDHVEMKAVDPQDAQPSPPVTYSLYEGEGTNGTLLATAQTSTATSSLWFKVFFPSRYLWRRG